MYGLMDVAVIRGAIYHIET